MDFLIQLSNELVNRNEKVVSLLALKDRNVVKLVSMVGKEGQRRGIDARKIVQEAASRLGGGGSGRISFAQGGGNLVEATDEVLEKTRMVIRKMVKR